MQHLMEVGDKVCYGKMCAMKDEIITTEVLLVILVLFGLPILFLAL